jgi:membrane fusion protein (multidrug efflux system)
MKNIKTFCFWFYLLVAMGSLVLTNPVLAAKHLAKTSDIIPVEVTTVSNGSVPITITAIGDLKASQQVDISPQVSGQLIRIDFKDGQHIRKGASLFQLDDSLLRAQLATAAAKLHLSEVSYKRVLRLSKTQSVSYDALDQAKAQLEQDKAQYHENLLQVQQMHLTAPFDGILKNATISIGQYVAVGQTLVTLEGTQKLDVYYSLPQANLSQLTLGQPVTVTSNSFPNQIFKGLVTYISPAIDVNSRTVDVHAQIDNHKQLLLPGMFVNVAQLLSTRKAIIIPDEALVANIAGDQVYVIKDNKALQRNVTVGMRWQNQAEIISGLAIGEQLVVAGQLRLRDGAMVSISRKAS